MKTVRRNNVWAALKCVVLGSYPSAQHFSFIRKASIRDPLMRLADEINQDLDQFEHLLTTHGCRVLRPTVMPVEEFQEFVEINKKLPEPPLQVRNTHVAVYDTLLRVHPGPREVDHLFDQQPQLVDLSRAVSMCHEQGLRDNHECYNTSVNTWFRKSRYQELSGPDWPDFYDYVQGARSSQPHIAHEMSQFESCLIYEPKEFFSLSGPNIIPLPDRVVIDCNEYSDYADMLAPFATNRITKINTGAGHTDGCFMLLGHHTIVGIDSIIDYRRHFPDFEVITIPATMYGDVMQWNHIHRAQPKWWINDQDDNEEMRHFIETYMQDYVGNVYETLFDINALSLGSDVICISHDNTNIRRKLEKRGIESIVVPWRHRFFVDGGLHCITLDLCREDA